MSGINQFATSGRVLATPPAADPVTARIRGAAASWHSMPESWALTAAIGTLPFLGPAYEDESGKVDIHLTLSVTTLFLSTLILIVVGVISGWVPAMQAAKLDPVEALRYE